MGPHQWEQNRWWWICARCGASTISETEPEERDGGLWFNLPNRSPTWRKSIEFGPDCDLELVRSVMES